MIKKIICVSKGLMKTSMQDFTRFTPLFNRNRRNSSTRSKTPPKTFPIKVISNFGRTCRTTLNSHPSPANHGPSPFNPSELVQLIRRGRTSRPPRIHPVNIYESPITIFNSLGRRWLFPPENFSQRTERGRSGDQGWRGVGSRKQKEDRERAAKLMHNLLRPEEEEGVSRLGVAGLEMEIVRRNLIRRVHFHARTGRLRCHPVFFTAIVAGGMSIWILLKSMLLTTQGWKILLDFMVEN